jgi:hypothetical protein
MILIGLVVLIAVLMVFAVPHLWRKLSVPDVSHPDVSHKAASRALRARER